MQFKVVVSKTFLRLLSFAIDLHLVLFFIQIFKNYKDIVMKTFKSLYILFCVCFLCETVNAQWSLLGNSGLTPKNFFGTTDASVLTIKVNNQKSGIITYNSSSKLTSFGYQSLMVNSNGIYNTAIGYTALSANTSGSNNTGVGVNALRSNVGGSYNTAVGSGALSGNISGLNNTAIGNAPLYFNSSGNSNVAIGNFPLYGNHSGYGNVAIGSYCLFSSTSGYSNISIGDSSLYNNQSGYSNVAIGAGALFKNQISHNVVAIGDSALYNQTSDAFSHGDVGNTAVGSKSLYSNTIGKSNTAVGKKSLVNNTEGNDNTAVGAYTLSSNTKGNANSAVGLEVLPDNTEGSYNTAQGNNALQSNITGSHNTAVGYHSLYHNSTGAYNTAIGEQAGENGTQEFYCTYLGYNTGSNTINHLTNSMALGNGARYTASNYIAVGNTAIKSIKGHVLFTTFSDGRFKKDIKENVPGLQFINKLKPVTYHLDVTGISKFLKEDDNDNMNNTEKKSFQNSMQKARQEKEKIVYTGFVAQDVEKAAKELNYDFDGVDKPENENSLYGLRYAEFVVPLVKAVQELSKKNDAKDSLIGDLQNKNTAQQIQIDNLQKQMDQIKAMIISGNQSSVISQQSTIISSASLSQNIPNPFNNITTIGYSIPQKFSSAQIIISDQSGKVLKQVNAGGAGKGSLKVDASTLASGAYSYSLIVDGKLIDTKQMVLVK